MKFCQTDGTVLIDDAPADPYKTVVGNQSEIASAIPPLDPFKTMVASSPKHAEDDLLQLPDEQNALKTMVVSPDELKEELKAGGAEDVPPLDLPAQYAPSAPLIEPKPAVAPNDFSSPKSNEPSLSPPNFGNAGQESGLPKPSDALSSDATIVMGSNPPQENPPSPFDSKPFQNDFSSQSPYGNQENKPIPSPFQDSLPPNYPTPAAPPFDAPKPQFQEPEPVFGSQPESPNQSPFQPPTPFGQPESFNAPLQQSAWTPPPVPVSEWENQELGANTPFQPPAAGIGQNQTLPIISLVLGIISLCCYIGWITGPAALVTGYLGMRNANTDPNQYGGKGLALAGMIVGGIFTAIWVIYWLVIILFYAGLIASTTLGR